MKNQERIENQPLIGKNDCDCKGNDHCCTPKKRNPWVKILFTMVLLAAIGIVAVKLLQQPTPAVAKEACCPPGTGLECDSTTTAGCDTSKASSCCLK
jgi:hypothetical protein